MDEYTIPAIEQLLGTWVSECTHPEHLDDECQVSFFFDRLPFGENPDLLRIVSTVNKKEEILFTGELHIEAGESGMFFLNVGAEKISGFDFQEKSFVADLEGYGSMILIRKN